jgi:hypothetical protein
MPVAVTNGYRHLLAAGSVPGSMIPVIRTKIGAVYAGLAEAASRRVAPRPGLSKLYAFTMRATVVEVFFAGPPRWRPADNGVGRGIAKCVWGRAQFDRVSAPAVKTISRLGRGWKKPGR